MIRFLEVEPCTRFSGSLQSYCWAQARSTLLRVGEAIRMRDVFWLFAFALIGVSLLLLGGTTGVQSVLGNAVQNAVQQGAWSGQSVVQNGGGAGGFSPSGGGESGAVNQAVNTALTADLAPIVAELQTNPQNTVGGQPLTINGKTVAYVAASIQSNVVEVQVSGAVSVPWFSNWMAGILNRQTLNPASAFNLTAWGNTP